MVLADPGLVVVELIEVHEQVHVALEREQRVLAHGVKRREEHAGLYVAVVDVGHGPRLRNRDGSGCGPINNRGGGARRAVTAALCGVSLMNVTNDQVQPHTEGPPFSAQMEPRVANRKTSTALRRSHS